MSIQKKLLHVCILRRAIEIYTKHFEQWQTKYLHVCLAGGEMPARLFANWILKRDTPQYIPQNITMKSIGLK